MRPFRLSLCLLLILAAHAGVAQAAEHPVDPAVQGVPELRLVAMPCDASVPDPAASGELPGWLLLASALVLLAAGRLARHR